MKKITEMIESHVSMSLIEISQKFMEILNSNNTES